MSSQNPSNSHVGPKTTGGKAGEVPTPANAHLGTEKLETKPKAFDSDGAIGKQFTGMFRLALPLCFPLFPTFLSYPLSPVLFLSPFISSRLSFQDSRRAMTNPPPLTETGAIGQLGEKVGGPLSSDGVIGKQFTDQGAIGGAIQDTLGGNKQTGPGSSGIPKSN